MRKSKKYSHRILLFPSHFSHKWAVECGLQDAEGLIPHNHTERILTMKHKLYALLLAGAMALSLAACGTNAANPSDNGADNSAGVSQPPATAPAADPTQTGTTAASGSQTIKLTLEGDEGTQEITATLMDTPAAAEFAGHMPFTVEMHEHLGRQKEVYLDFSLSEESQTNTVHEYEIGDIVYWHPGPTMGIFHDHDGRSISAGVEVLARLDEGGAQVIASYADLVRVTFELDEGESGVPAGAQLEITLSGPEGEHTITAALLDTPAAAEFATHLPLSFHMTDYANREKHAHMDFSIDDSLLENITVDYEIGDIIYYPPGPTYAMYYDHDGRTIAAGMEVIARMDQAGIEALGSYANDVDVTVSVAH